jgi:hypothetical protein
MSATFLHSPRMMLTVLLAVAGAARALPAMATEGFQGRYFSGTGDTEYLQLLDISARMFSPDPEFQNIAMVYKPDWNGLVEGPTWNAWWIQNSYGPSYCAMPFLQEPLTTFLQNSQDLWFDQMGDGKTVRPFKRFEWVPPDGCLCDCARPGLSISKQGDGRVNIHDWGMEFTAAGVVLQAELLLISRDREAIGRYLPKLRRCVEFIETRRDPKNNLFLAGPAGNLLAPSYAGWKKPDGSFDKAYLAGLSITYIAALDRLIELEKFIGNSEKEQLYSQRREDARKGLALLTTDEGYFIKSLDPDGTRHGVYGAEKHGYFEAVANHDAICFRVADDAQAEKIYAKIASIPGLRTHDVIITNYPGLDDMYVPDKDRLWSFGYWVNGGHWTTCEARMIMAYYRLGKHDDARRSMKHILSFARRFRMENNLTNFGADLYQPDLPINCVYDTWGAPAAMVRGLFEYQYTAEGLRILPHVPPSIERLEQHFPIRFGAKRIFLAVEGKGNVTGVRVNGKSRERFERDSIFLPFDETPDEAIVVISLGGANAAPFAPRRADRDENEPLPALDGLPTTPALEGLAKLKPSVVAASDFRRRLLAANLGNSYEAAHTRLIVDCYAAAVERLSKNAAGELPPLPAESQAAADQSYVDCVSRLSSGLEQVMQSYAKSDDPRKQRIWSLWNK